MRPEKIIKKYIYLIIILLLGLQNVMSITVYGKEEADKISDAKQGIVEIKAGFTDKNGRFHMLKRTSGCLISNGDGKTYIATTYHSVNVSNKEKAAYCEEKEIEAEVNELAESIRIMIKGDVSVDAVVMTESQAKDYCLLSVDSVINEKNALRLGNSSDLKIGEAAYALGFSDEVLENSSVQYTQDDVEIHAGYIQDASTNHKKAVCIQHSGVVTSGNSGGALVDSEGYLIGLNNSDYTNQDINAYYSLAVDEIKEILDNYGILYESKEKDEAYQALTELYEKCRKLEESGEYKGESLITMQQNLQNIESAMKESELTIESIKEKTLTLDESRNSLEKKMPLTRKIIYGLGICCVLLLAKLIHLIIVWRKGKKLPQNETKQSITNERNKMDQSGEFMSDMHNQNSYKMDKNDSKKHIDIEQVALEESTTLLFKQDHMSEDDRTELHNPLNYMFQKNAKKATLEQERTRKVINISKPEFIVGKKPELVDFAVTDNKVISRIHAVILWEDGIYSIQDKESVNGTFVNGKKIETEAVPLKDGDEIALANEIFTFRVTD